MFTTKPLSQRDDLWKNFKLGNGACTIGSDGCLLTCFTMLCQSADVRSMDMWRMAHNGYYGAMASTFDLLDATRLVKYIKPPTPEGRYVRTAFPDTEKLQAHLDAGNPAIIEVNWYRRFRPWVWRVAYSMHFVLLLPDMTVYDPWPMPNEGKTVCGLDEYGDSPEEAVVRAIYYEVIK